MGPGRVCVPDCVVYKSLFCYGNIDELEEMGELVDDIKFFVWDSDCSD
jgi:hypothetical protein